MENIVQKTKQGIENMLVELKAQRAFHEQSLAQIIDTIAKLEAAVESIGTDVSVPTPAKATAKKAAAKTKTTAKTAKKGKPRNTAVKKAAAKTTAKTTKKGKPKSTAARLAGTMTLDPTTAIDAVGFSPRIVRLCKRASIETIADLAKHDLRQLAKTADRIGEVAIQEMIAAVKRAGLKVVEATKPNGVHMSTASA
jgi:DNA-directed RNA polymerase alpha subunit